MGVNWARSPYVDYGEDNPKKSVEELIANLAQEVAQLKREVNELKASKANREDVEKFAETATQAELVAKKASEDILALAYDVDSLKRAEMERRK